MADLRTAFEDHGFEAVGTFIQSGNVLFESDAPRDGLENDTENMLGRRFGVPLMVVVRSHRQLRAVVDQAPSGFDRLSKRLAPSRMSQIAGTPQYQRMMIRNRRTTTALLRPLGRAVKSPSSRPLPRHRAGGAAEIVGVDRREGDHG